MVLLSHRNHSFPGHEPIPAKRQHLARLPALSTLPALLLLCLELATAGGAGAEVIVEDEAIAVVFADGRAAIFDRRHGRGITGLRRIRVDGRDIVSRPPDLDTDGARAAVLSHHRAGGVRDWRGYLLKRFDSGSGEELAWAPRNPRLLRYRALGGGTYLGHATEGTAVVLLVRPAFDPAAELAWIVRPEEVVIGDRTYRGLSWRLGVRGLTTVAWVELDEFQWADRGDLYLQQAWGRFIEHEVGNEAIPLLPTGWQNANHQPFTFVAGGRGSVLSFYEAPVAARLTVHGDGPVLLHRWQIPLGKGEVRSTPAKLWLAVQIPRGR